MSAWGNILDALLVHVDTALGAGVTLTQIRRYRTPDQLIQASRADMDATAGKAICIAWIPNTNGVRRASGRQVERTIAAQLQLWQGFASDDLGAQEAVYLQRDAIVDGVEADPTLGVLVRDVYVEAESPIEFEGGEIALVINFAVSQEEAE